MTTIPDKFDLEQLWWTVRSSDLAHWATYTTHTTKQGIVHVHGENKKTKKSLPTYPILFKDETLNTHFFVVGLVS